jgi:hypothetical protein
MLNLNVPVRETDVLCGRGGLSNKHAGNRMFRRIVQENKKIYQSFENPSKKQLMVSSIIKAIKLHGGRFVRKERNEWVEISYKATCLKTSQILRELDSTEPSSATYNTPSKTTSPLSKAKETIRKRQKLARPGQKLPRQGTDRSVSAGEENVTSDTQFPLNELEADEKHREFEDFLSELYTTTPSTTSSSNTVAAEADFQQQSTENEPSPHKRSASIISVDLDSSTRNKSNESDLCPLGPNEFLFETRLEFEELCIGLLDTLVES